MLSRTGSGQTLWKRPPRSEVSKVGVTQNLPRDPHFLVPAPPGKQTRTSKLTATHPAQLPTGARGRGLTSAGQNQAKESEKTQATRGRHLWGEWGVRSVRHGLEHPQPNPLGSRSSPSLPAADTPGSKNHLQG